MKRIVVGVDGSVESQAALRWAAEEARRHGASLEVVHVYEPMAVYEPYVHPTILVAGGGSEADQEQAAEQARALIQRQVAELEDRDSLVIEPVPVTDRHAARALVECAQGADLLVVGSRGLGGFAGLVLGSVSQQCAQHTPCPLTIVPGTG